MLLHRCRPGGCRELPAARTYTGASRPKATAASPLQWSVHSLPSAALPLLVAAASACGADASGGAPSSDTRASSLSQPVLEARVEVIGEAPALERSGHSVLGLRNRVYVA